MKRFLGKTKNYITNTRKIMSFYYQANKGVSLMLSFSVIAISLIPFVNAYVFKLIIDRIVDVIKSGEVSLQPFVPLLSIFIILGFVNRLFW